MVEQKHALSSIKKIKTNRRYVEFPFTFDFDTPAVAQELKSNWRIHLTLSNRCSFFSKTRFLFRNIVDYPSLADIVLQNCMPFPTIRAYDFGFPSALRINTVLDSVWQKFLDVYFASRKWKKQDNSSLSIKWVLPRGVPLFCIGARIISTIWIHWPANTFILWLL